MRIEFKRHDSVNDCKIGKEVGYMAAWRYQRATGTAIAHILAAFQESSHYASNFNVTMKLKNPPRWIEFLIDDRNTCPYQKYCVFQTLNLRSLVVDRSALEGSPTFLMHVNEGGFLIFG
jgi:hypothetical protein